MQTSHLLDRPVAEQAAAVAADPALATELTGEAQRRIAADRAHAWVAVHPGAGEDAARLGVTGPPALAGVPFGVKDIIDVAGLATRCGSVITSPDPVEGSATCVQRLERLGAVVQGKTVTTEFAYFAPGPTDNPRAPGHTPGGSSSGSAAAVAAGHVPLALGSQTAGSLTRPASFCGVAGMVTAVGSTDLSGVTGLSPALDSLGLLTRTVTDLSTVHAALTGATPASPAPVPLLVWGGSGLDEVEDPMAAAVRSLAQAAAAEGVQVAQLDADDLVLALTEDHATIMAYQAALAHPDLGTDERVSEPLRLLISTGAGIGPDQFEHALYRRDRTRDELAGALSGRLVIGPAALGPAPAGLAATGSPVLSRPWQALGLPVVTVPGATAADGRPLGIQVVGWPGREDLLLAGAGHLELLLRNPT